MFTVSRRKLLNLQWHIIQVTRGRHTFIQFLDQIKVAVVERYCEACDDASTPSKDKHSLRRTREKRFIILAAMANE